MTGCHSLDDEQTTYQDKESSDTVQQGPHSEPAPQPRLNSESHPRTRCVYARSWPRSRNGRPKSKLGQMLYFDKVVSGNQDIACSTCHHPSFGTSDGLPTIGGGNALGPQRAQTDGFVILETHQTFSIVA